MTVHIRPLTGEPAVIERLADILIATVAAGGSVSFLHPLPRETAVAYWREALADPGRVVLGGYVDQQLVGTVTLWLATPANQPFRAEIWKLMTDPAARRRGVARALMVAAEQLAVERGRTLLTSTPRPITAPRRCTTRSAGPAPARSRALRTGRTAG